MTRLSHNSQREVSAINMVIAILFPQLKTLSQYCLALGYSEDQLKAMNLEQIEYFINEFDSFLNGVNALDRARRNAAVISKSGNDVEQAKAAFGNSDTTSKSHTSSGDMVRVNWYGEAQDKLDAGTHDNLALKDALQDFTLSFLSDVVGEPANLQ